MSDANHGAERPLANGRTRIDFQTDPSRYRHWKLVVDGEIATLLMDVDEIVPGSKFDETVGARARDFAAKSGRAPAGRGIKLTPLARTFTADSVDYQTLAVEFDRKGRIATVTLRGPDAPPPLSAEATVELGAAFWPLKLARALDDAILHIRFNEPEVAAIVFKSAGDPAVVMAYEDFLDAHSEHWLTREIRHLWKRVLKRVDLTSRSLVTLIEPGSCFAGTLAELPFASDRSYMLLGTREGDNRAPAVIVLSAANFGAYPMANGLTRLASRFLANPTDLEKVRASAASRSMPRRRGGSDSSPSRSTTSTGATRCACSLKSARAFRPTGSPGLRPTCASPGRKPWNRKSLPG